MNSKLFVRAAALSALLAVTATAQVVPQVIGLGGGCGVPKPLLNASSPYLGVDLTIFVTSVTPGCPTTIFVSPPPAAPFPIGADCFSWINTAVPVFTVSGVADARGAYVVTFPLSVLAGFGPGVACNIQAACVPPAGTPGTVNFLGIDGFVTDGVQIIMGNVPKDPPTDVPQGACCTFPRDEFDDCCSNGGWGSSGCGGSGGYGGWGGYGGGCGSGGWGGWSGGGCGGSGGGWGGWGGCGSGGTPTVTACSLLNDNYSTLFPSGLIVGIYNTSSCNYPNGKKFSTSSTGKSKLKSYLTGDSSSSGGTFDNDTLNNDESTGGGKLGREAAALALNIKFSDAGLVGPGCVFGDLVLVAPGSSLNGATVRQILVAVNKALSGQGLPSGYTFSSLKTLVSNLNMAYDDCVTSEWAKTNLYRPNA